MSYITFIIPSLGRQFLHKTLLSLEQQLDPDWEAIVMFDGVPKTIQETEKIKVIESPKVGYPGKMRNQMIALANSKWVGFVDDDNYIKNTYITNLKKHDSGLFDIVHFSMIYTWSNQVLPQPNINEVTYGQFGVSFAVTKEFINRENVSFIENDGSEDYKFLMSAKSKGARINITHDTQYIVDKISGWRQ